MHYTGLLLFPSCSGTPGKWKSTSSTLSPACITANKMLPLHHCVLFLLKEVKQWLNIWQTKQEEQERGREKDASLFEETNVGSISEFSERAMKSLLSPAHRSTRDLKFERVLTLQWSYFNMATTENEALEQNTTMTSYTCQPEGDTNESLFHFCIEDNNAVWRNPFCHCLTFSQSDHFTSKYS